MSFHCCYSEADRRNTRLCLPAIGPILMEQEQALSSELLPCGFSALFWQQQAAAAAAAAGFLRSLQ